MIANDTTFATMGMSTGSDIMNKHVSSTAAAQSALAFQVPANRWSDERAATLSPAELLLYRSNLLGSDLTVTNFGGGNTSAKLS